MLQERPDYNLWSCKRWQVLSLCSMSLSSLLDLSCAFSQMGKMMSTSWRPGIRPDLPIVCTLILLNTLKRNQTCNPMFLKSMHSTAGAPNSRTRSRYRQGLRSVALHSAPLHSSMPMFHLTFRRPHASFCFVLVQWFLLRFRAHATCVSSGWYLVAIYLKIWSSFQLKSNTWCEEW